MGAVRDSELIDTALRFYATVRSGHPVAEEIGDLMRRRRTDGGNCCCGETEQAWRLCPIHKDE